MLLLKEVQRGTKREKVVSNIVNFGQGGVEGIIFAILVSIAFIGALLLGISIGDIINGKPVNKGQIVAGAVMMVFGITFAKAIKPSQK